MLNWFLTLTLGLKAFWNVEQYAFNSILVMNAEQASRTKPILVAGPARSGKSEWAESLALQTGLPVIYVATARIDREDAEWVARISEHQRRRDRSGWTTMEVPVELAGALARGPSDTCLLVDSLGTWVANLLESDETVWQQHQQELLQEAIDFAGRVIFVAEETGWGVVPAYPLGRKFRDRLGTLVRRLGAIADPVYLVTCGRVLNLSLLGHPLP